MFDAATSFPVKTSAEELGQFLTAPNEINNAIEDLQYTWEAPTEWQLTYFAYVAAQIPQLEEEAENARKKHEDAIAKREELFQIL